MANICVIALMGLPASGKTTFCETFLKQSIKFNCIHICYDEIFTFLPQCGAVTFKEERGKVLHKIEQITNYIKSNKYPIEGVNCSKKVSCKDFVIICDDNNYYAGMRYELYKLCKQNRLSFGQIYFAVDLKDALSRNAVRGASALPASVIEQMSRRLQEPSSRNQWEKNTFTISSTSDLEELKAFVKMCLDNPLKLVSKGKEDTKKMNLIHEIDIILRKKIKELLQGFDGDLSNKAKQLNKNRKSILLDAKNKDITEVDVDCLIERLLSE